MLTYAKGKGTGGFLFFLSFFLFEGTEVELFLATYMHADGREIGWM